MRQRAAYVRLYRSPHLPPSAPRASAQAGGSDLSCAAIAPLNPHPPNTRARSAAYRVTPLKRIATSASARAYARLKEGVQMQNNTGGVGFGSLLLVLFIGLKLGKVIDWSWWWVLSPMWIPLCALAVLGIIVLACGGLAAGVQAFFTNRAAVKRWSRK